MQERSRKQDVLKEIEEGNWEAEKQGEEKKTKKQMGEEMKSGNTFINYYEICFISSLIKLVFLFVFVLTVPFKLLLNLPQECKNGSFPRQFPN